MEFLVGTPDVSTGGYDVFIALVQGPVSRYVSPYYYLNRYPLEYEDCQCDHDHEHEHDDGCPTTGWFELSSNPYYDESFTRLNHEVVAYMKLPDAETSVKMIKGPW